ncbi:MAG TPA: MBL fold metallo-hydrolase [Clostridiaceae bacterium]|nr:MBL fold metallo-hydrolase [Clostridiaceae bacterium]
MIGSVALRSGSSGNCTLIRNGETRIIVDCGINGKTFTGALALAGESPLDIDGILITHEHSDHVSGLGVILRKYKIPFYITEKTLELIFDHIGKFDPDLLNIIKPEEEFSIKDQLVRSFKVPHDAAETLAYRFVTPRGDITVCTDIGSVDQVILDQIIGSRLIILESNYDWQLLKNGPYPRILKDRISNGHGHLSNDQCGETLCHLVEKGTEQIVLAHLSKENNHPSIAELTTVQSLDNIGAIQDKDYVLQVAKRYSNSDWMQI